MYINKDFELSGDIPKWEKQKGETAKAFNAFIHYLNMKTPGHGRSLKKLTLLLNQKSVAGIKKWSSLYKWQERVDAYDEYQHKVLMEEMAKQHKAMCKGYAKAFAIPIEALGGIIHDEKRCKSFIAKIQSDAEADPIKFLEDISKLSGYYTKLAQFERLINDQPTEITKTELTSDGEVVQVILPKNPVVNEI